MEMLKDKVALITGAARGIGKAIALKYASEGANIAFTDLVINEAAEETVKELEAFGVKVKAYASNAAEFEATQAVVDQVVADFGRIDVLVNNAGITKDGLVMRMSEQQWDAVIAVNMKSAFNFMHAVVPVMARQRSGSIINMASIAGQTGNPGQVNYSASKAGLIAMAKSVAKEMGSRGIRANAIAPGYVISEMTEALPQSVRDEFVKMIPLGRGASVDEIASVALFLASDLASYVTGQVIAVNGGMYC
jgi:3-oxoacyl-[acyl-carrier protein] reductase